VEISFETKELREICRSSEVAEQSLPRTVARSLRAVVADLRAARYFDEFTQIQGLPGTEECAVPLGDGYKLHVASGHRITPRTDRDFDPTKVYRVRVLAIEEGR
jgi:hypothetical protein